MMNWYAVHTNSRQEANAAGHLWRQGFEIFFPRQWKRIRHARKSSMEMRPYFPRYVFTKTPLNGFETIRRTIGVSTIVTNHGTPLAIPEPLMTELRKRFDEDGCLPADAVPALHDFRLGETVSISEGPLAGLTALVDGIDETRHLRVLLTIFGRATRANIVADWVKHLSPEVRTLREIHEKSVNGHSRSAA